MAIDKQTLTRIQSLARLYQTGYHSRTIDMTINKLVGIERARLQAESDDLAARLLLFEQQHHLSSEEFHHRFQAGKMGDKADMFEWDALYLMWLSVQEKFTTLQSESA